MNHFHGVFTGDNATSSPGHLLPFRKRLHGQQILRVMRFVSSRNTNGPENQVADNRLNSAFSLVLSAKEI